MPLPQEQLNHQILHKQYLIFKLEQCTLPLCQECENIHLEQHQAKQTKSHLIRFNEAYLKALNDFQECISQHSDKHEQLKDSIQKDKAKVMSIIDRFYEQKIHIIEAAASSLQDIQDKFNKIKKGSIKTLIYYYSGEIQLAQPTFEMEELHQKLQNVIENIKNQTSLTLKLQQKISMLEKTLDQALHKKKEGFREIETQTQQYQANNTTKVEDTGCVNSNKELRSRKCIFQQNIKKPSQATQRQRFYHHNEDFEVKVEKSMKEAENNEVLISPQTFRLRQEEVRQACKLQTRQERKSVEDLTGHLQYQNYLQSRKQINANQDIVMKEHKSYQYLKEDKREEQKENKQDYHRNQLDQPINQFTHYSRPLKPSDLEVEDLSSKDSFFKTNSIPRPRTYSQTQLNYKREDGLNKVGQFELNMKKQVLSPEEIRKMLQKRIEERNRVLQIKKNETNQAILNSKTVTYGHQKVIQNGFMNGSVIKEERQIERKLWDTKDSIINQIYHDKSEIY